MPIDVNSVFFLPCGDFDLALLHLLAGDAGKILSVPIRVVPQPMPLPGEAYNQRRNQYHAGMLLKLLADRYAEHFKIVGLTRHDLFLPIFTHVYGEAQMPGRAAIVSTFRLTGGAPDGPGKQDRTNARAVKIAVHELLHTFELTHCTQTECLMQPIVSVAQLDAVPLKLCRSCLNFWKKAAG